MSDVLSSVPFIPAITTRYAVDGIAGFWAGVGPNVMRCFLVNAAELGTYDQAKHEVQKAKLFDG